MADQTDTPTPPPAGKTTPKGKGRRTGRTPKLTPAIADIIVEGAKLGMPATYTANLARVNESTIRRWVKRGKRERKGPFFELRNRVVAAEAAVISRNLEIIRAAAASGPRHWKAAAWLLERYDADNFGRNQVELADLWKQAKDQAKRVERMEKEAEEQAQRTADARAYFTPPPPAPPADDGMVRCPETGVWMHWRGVMASLLRRQGITPSTVLNANDRYRADTPPAVTTGEVVTPDPARDDDGGPLTLDGDDPL